MHDPHVLTLIAGPCVLEQDGITALRIAEHLAKLRQDLPIEILFKASFDKANRTRVDAFRGPGLERGLKLLESIHNETNLPILTDIHLPSQAAPVAEVAHVLQIPAFLARQTDLITAAAQTGRPINIKKPQFVAPEDTLWIAEKARTAGAHTLLITERGTCFGYRDLIVDPRSLATLVDASTKHDFFPVFDATHSVQQPSAHQGSSGGLRHFIAPLSRAAAAIGVRNFFLETYPDPSKALCDGPNALHLHDLRPLVETLITLLQALQTNTPRFSLNTPNKTRTNMTEKVDPKA